MSAIEAMARAHYAADDGIFEPWQDLNRHEKRRELKMMRAALIALRDYEMTQHIRTSLVMIDAILEGQP